MQSDHESNLRNSLKELKKLPKLNFSKESASSGKEDYSVRETSVSPCGVDGSNKRNAGRYRMNEEDRAKPKTFRLTNTDLELLSYSVGKNDTEKLKHLIHNHYRFSLKMNRYSKRLKSVIHVAYKDLRMCFDPELHQEDQTKKNKLIGAFKESYLELVATIEFFEFDTQDFNELLSSSENVKLSAILMGKESLL